MVPAAPRQTIPGYRFGDPALPPSPLGPAAFEELKASLGFGPDDVAALAEAGDALEDKVERVLDVWYGFVGATPHLLALFSHPATGVPDGAYLAAVRARFGRWILDTCHARYDGAWLAWADEIGRRHHRVGKNRTDGAAAPAHVPLRHLLALAVPISATVRPFLAEDGAPAGRVEAMHAAWTKSVWLQAILWSRPYANEGDF